VRQSCVRWELGKIAEKGMLKHTVFVSADPESNVGVYGELRKLASVRPPESTQARDAFEHFQETVRGLQGRLPEGFPGTTQEGLATTESAVQAIENVNRGVALIGVAQLASVFVLADNDVEQLTGPLDQTLPKAMKLIGQEPTSKGLIDLENPWQFENVIAILGVVTAALAFLLPLAFLMPSLFESVGLVGVAAFIKAEFLYFLFGWLGLFFLVFILRP
jgi:hypothetical protein